MRIIRVVTCWSLTLGGAQSLPAQEASPSPRETLARAVDKSIRCLAYPDTGRDGKAPKVSGEETSFATRLDIRLMFKPGRYDLKREMDSSTAEGRREIVIHFTPRTSGEQIERAEGESANLNKVLNNLAGFVYIDPETESITRIYGDLADNVWVEKHGAPANITVLSFQYHQVPQAGRWIPATLKANAKLWLGFFLPWSPKYALRFSCGT